MSRLADGWVDEAYIGALSFTLSVFALPCFRLRLLGIGLFTSASHLPITRSAWEVGNAPIHWTESDNGYTTRQPAARECQNC